MIVVAGLSGLIIDDAVAVNEIPGSDNVQMSQRLMRKVGEAGIQGGDQHPGAAKAQVMQGRGVDLAVLVERRSVIQSGGRGSAAQKRMGCRFRQRRTAPAHQIDPHYERHSGDLRQRFCGRFQRYGIKPARFDPQLFRQRAHFPDVFAAQRQVMFIYQIGDSPFPHPALVGPRIQPRRNIGLLAEQ
ncbi:MAG: hypothetical protein KDH84_05800, partial [Calditrichaeota bacterium]|nr:hypothetical protein [Calditrichota bacterium]